MEQEFVSPFTEDKNAASLLDDLLDMIDGMEAEETGMSDADKVFAVDTPQQLEYVLRKYKDLLMEESEAQAAAQTEIDRHAEKVQTWLDKKIKPIAYSKEYFLKLLENYAQTHIDPNGKKKSISMINGSVGYRKQGAKFDYNEDILLEDIKINHPEFIENKPTVKKAELKKKATVKDGMLYLDGVLILGVTIEDQPDKFEVK